MSIAKDSRVENLQRLSLPFPAPFWLWSLLTDETDTDYKS